MKMEWLGKVKINKDLFNMRKNRFIKRKEEKFCNEDPELRNCSINAGFYLSVHKICIIINFITLPPG